MSQVKLTFQANKNIQYFTVPPYVTSVRMQLWGAYGGDRNQGVGSASFSGVGYVDGTLPVTQGQQYFVFVGGQGGSQQISARVGATVTAPGGWNGGGAGGSACTSNAQVWRVSGNGGGGATDVRFGDYGPYARILVAGGAGGSGENMFFNSQNQSSSPEQQLNADSPNPPYTGSTTDWFYNTFQDDLGGTGGYGGGDTAQWGGPSTTQNSLTTNGSGGPGSPYAGGRGSTQNSRYIQDGSAGTLGVGGNGGSITQSMAYSYGLLYGGGGGGGGYYGGGGGSTDYGKYTTIQGANGAGGGGGGSNYVNGSFLNSQSLAHAQNPVALGGGNYFDGYAVFTYDQPPSQPYVLSPKNNSFFDVTQPLTFNWLYTSADTSTWQQGFEIDYQVQGSSTWNSFPTTTSKAGTYTFPANTFTNGTTYSFRLRYYDNTGDVSSFTTMTLVGETPNPAPVITAPSPGASLDSKEFVVSWNPPANESNVRVRVIDQDGNVVGTSLDMASTRINWCATPTADSNPSSNNFGGIGPMCLLPQTYGGNITASTNINARGVSGGKSYEIAWGSSSDPLYMASYRWITTVPGETYHVSLGYAKANAGGTEVQLSVTGEYQTVGDVSTLGTSTNTFQLLTCTFVADSSYAFINISPVGSTVAGTDYGYVDAFLVEQGMANTTYKNLGFSRYFDGGNANGQGGTPSWLGWANVSTSALAPSTPISSFLVNGGDKVYQKLTVEVSYTTTTSKGLYSNIASEPVIINIAPPATPTATIYSNSELGCIYLAIVNPDGANPKNPTAYNDIYRQDMTNGGDSVRIATDVPVNSVFTDYTPATETTYAYTVRAISTAGGFAETQ